MLSVPTGTFSQLIARLYRSLEKSRDSTVLECRLDSELEIGVK